MQKSAKTWLVWLLLVAGSIAMSGCGTRSGPESDTQSTELDSSPQLTKEGAIACVKRDGGYAGYEYECHSLEHTPTSPQSDWACLATVMFRDGKIVPGRRLVAHVIYHENTKQWELVGVSEVVRVIRPY